MGMSEDILYYLFGVLAGAGLQEEMVCSDMLQPLLGVGIVGEHYFKFVCAREGDPCALLRGAGDPVDAVR